MKATPKTAKIEERNSDTSPYPIPAITEKIEAKQEEQCGIKRPLNKALPCLIHTL